MENTPNATETPETDTTDNTDPFDLWFKLHEAAKAVHTDPNRDVAAGITFNRVNR